MKLSQIIIPLASAALARAHGEEAESEGYEPGVKFTDEGLTNILKVGAKHPDGDAPGAVGQLTAFMERNPAIKKSLEEVVNDPKNARAVAKGATLVSKILSSTEGDAVNLYEAKVQALDFTYDNPDFFELVQTIAMRIIKTSPTLLDDFFTTLGRLVKKNPALFAMMRQELMDFSHDNEEAYKKSFELMLKASLRNVDFSSYALIHILKLDKNACGAASGGSCSCDEPHAAVSEGDDAPAHEEEPVADEHPQNYESETVPPPDSEGEVQPEEAPEAYTGYDASPAPVSEGETAPPAPAYDATPAPVSEGEKAPPAPAYVPEAPREPEPAPAYTAEPAPVAEGEEECDEEEEEVPLESSGEVTPSYDTEPVAPEAPMESEGETEAPVEAPDNTETEEMEGNTMQEAPEEFPTAEEEEEEEEEEVEVPDSVGETEAPEVYEEEAPEPIIEQTPVSEGAKEEPKYEAKEAPVVPEEPKPSEAKEVEEVPEEASQEPIPESEGQVEAPKPYDVKEVDEEEEEEEMVEAPASEGETDDTESYETDEAPEPAPVSEGETDDTKNYETEDAPEPAPVSEGETDDTKSYETEDVPEPAPVSEGETDDTKSYETEDAPEPAPVSEGETDDTESYETEDAPQSEGEVETPKEVYDTKAPKAIEEAEEEDDEEEDEEEDEEVVEEDEEEDEPATPVSEGSVEPEPIEEASSTSYVRPEVIQDKPKDTYAVKPPKNDAYTI